MLLALLAYFGGVLTILSPCILPVLPFVFARADKPFRTNGLPLLVGMALTFALVASLAAIGGEAALAANQAGRWIALVLFAGFGLMLLFPAIADRAMQPLVRLGGRLGERADKGGAGSSLLLGLATGLLWAPCAGPILGLILTGAAVSGASATTAVLLLAYALGAATSLGLALLVGGKLFAAMKRSIGAGEKVRKILGALILAAVAVIALGLDTRLLTNLSAGSTFSLEQGLARRLGMDDSMPQTSAGGLAVEGMLPPLDGAAGWINSPPLTREGLRGKVVLVDFWTYSCINCIRAVPHVRALYDRYSKDGLVVIGVHSPEFAFERDPANVAKAVKDFGIRYPVANDSKLAIWKAFNNRYWPAQYLVDAQGRIRYHHFGEGSEAQTEAAVRALLAEAGHASTGMASGAAAPAEALETDLRLPRSPETYLGASRMANFVSPGGAMRGPAYYRVPDLLNLNQWGLIGRWSVEPKLSRSAAPGAAIRYRFIGRDLHLVLGSSDGKPIPFTVTIDGKAPGADHGTDIDSAGRGTITGQRLYQLVRQKAGRGERVFEIRFDRPGAEAYAFTFG